MATPDTDTRTALQELLDERQRYEGWLHSLEQRRGSTPTHVYERVHTDYTLRLERVMERLRERAEQLSATIEGMQSRLETLRSRESDRSDERNEYELRAAVGELSPEEWDRRRTDIDRELSAIAEDRRQSEQELAEVQRIVAMTRESRAPAEAPAAEMPSAPVSEQAAQPTPESAPVPVSEAPRPVPEAPAAAAAAPPAATSSPAHEAPSTAGERPLATSGTGSPSIDDFIAEWPLRHMEAEHPAGAPADVNTPSTAPATATWHPPAHVEQGQGLAAAPAVQPAASSTPADLHQHQVGDGRRDMDKTLKCPECGAMNYATEWYCERCGGELASF